MSAMHTENKYGKITVTGNHLMIDGVVYKIPPHVRKDGNTTQCLIGTAFYINGYQFIHKTKEFKKTFMAWCHCYVFPFFW